MKVRSLLMYGEYQLALQEAEETNGMILYLGGQYGPFEYNFLYSLALAANYKKFLQIVKRNRLKKFGRIKNNCSFWQKVVPKIFIINIFS